MKKLINNEYVEMTPEEIAEVEKARVETPIQPAIPTEEQRISALEQAIADLALFFTINN